MSKQVSFKCDATGAFMSEDEAVPVTILRVRRETVGQSMETTLAEANGRKCADHISEDELSKRGFDCVDFEELQIIVLDQEVVGWRNYSPYVTTDVRNVTDKQAAFLKELTYL